MKELFSDYPKLTGANLILRKLEQNDAPYLETLTGEASVYETLPTFLYELRFTRQG